jgi:hypothetical protein
VADSFESWVHHIDFYLFEVSFKDKLIGRSKTIALAVHYQ